MPGYVKSKYSKEKSAEIAVEAFGAIGDANGEALTLEEIINSTVALVGTTPQKISRELSKYVDLNLIKKVKKNGRVAYCACNH